MGDFSEYLRRLGIINQDTPVTPSFRDSEGNISSTPSSPDRTTVTGNRNPFMNAETAAPTPRLAEIASMKALNDYKQPYQINQAQSPTGPGNTGPLKSLNYRQSEINSMNALGNMPNQQRMQQTQPTTTGRVSAPSQAPTQAQTPANQIYYLDRGNGGPLTPMGSQLPKSMSPGAQPDGSYIFGAAAPTKSLFGGNQQQQPSNVPTPPPRPANLGAAPQQQPQKNMDYGDRTPPLAVRQQQQQQSATPQDDSGFRQMALARNKELVDMGLSGDKAGGRINHAHKIAREKATPCHSGIINMAVGGRTDHIPMNVLQDSYVLPADIVSGLGEGNTLAGAKILDNMFTMGPMNTKMPNFRASPRVPADISPKPEIKFGQAPKYQAAGGRSVSTGSKPVPIIAAGGEYVIHPDVVAKMGQGNMDKGHAYFDNFVKFVRNHTAKTLQKLPGPRKD